MKLRHLLFILLLTILCQQRVMAQTLVLQHANGTTTEVELYTQPRVTFDGDKLLITSTVLYMEYPKQDVVRWTFKSKSSSISSIKNDVSYTRENGQLVFHGIKPNDKIALYTLKGIRVPVRMNRSGNSATLPLSSVPQGTYLLNVNGKTSKFTRP